MCKSKKRNRDQGMARVMMWVGPWGGVGGATEWKDEEKERVRKG